MKFLLLLLLWWPLGCDGSSSGDGGGSPQSASYPLHVSSDGRRLVDNQGRGFRINGDAGWLLMVVPTKAEAVTYLDDRKSRGFNTVVVKLIERAVGGPANAEGDAPFPSETNWSTFNDAYFDHAAWVLDRAAERGILVLLAPAYLGAHCDNDWCDPMLSQSLGTMRRYGRFLGDRFRSYDNIVWVNGGDVDAGSFNADARVNAIVEGIRERAPNHLHTAECSRGNSGIECYAEPWLDLNSTYSNCTGTLDAVRDDWERMPARVFFYIEGRYENEQDWSLGCLIDQHAWAVLGGSAGHVYGNGPIWRFSPGWQGDLDSRGATAMRNLSKLFRSRGNSGFVPDHAGDLLPRGGGGGALASRSRDGASLLVYVPSSRSLSVDVSPLGADVAQAWWYDPAEGRSQDLGQVSARGVVDFVAPGRRVLVLDDPARVQGAPGM